MPTKKIQEKHIPRVTQSDVYPEVGEAAEKLRAVVPIFGENIINAVVNAITTGQVRHGELELVSITEPKQIVKVAFDNSIGSKDIKVTLSGDWKQLQDISLDNPLFSPANGIVYRKHQPSDEKPIAEEGQTIEPNGAICAISQTKNNIWHLQLPSDKFPKGGILTKFIIPDGKEVKKGGIICYIKKIE
jgi:biotin carboxyl carrier protein